jgi:hypothetical protein
LLLAHGALTGLSLLALLVCAALLLLAPGVLLRLNLLLALAIVAMLLLLAFCLTGFIALAAFCPGIVLFVVVVGTSAPVLRRGCRTHAEGEGGAQRNGPESLLAKREFHVGFLVRATNGAVGLRVVGGRSNEWILRPIGAV